MSVKHSAFQDDTEHVKNFAAKIAQSITAKHPQLRTDLRTQSMEDLIDAYHFKFYSPQNCDGFYELARR